MDPHKRSVTIEVMLSPMSRWSAWAVRYTTVEGCQAMLAVAAWPGRVCGRRVAEGHPAGMSRTGCLPSRRDIGRAGEGCRVPGVHHRAGPQDRRHRRTFRSRWSAPDGGAATGGLRRLELEVLQLLVDRRRSIDDEHTRR